MGFGENLMRSRKKSGLSQEEVAAKLGVSRQTVSNWETGRNLPDIEALKALAEALEVPVEQLIYQEGRSPSRLARFPLDVWCRRLGIFVLVWGLLSGIRAGSGSGIMSDGGVGFVFTWRAALSVWYTALIRGSILLALGRVLTLLQDREPGGSPALWQYYLTAARVCQGKVRPPPVMGGG